MSMSSKTTPFSLELFSLACWAHRRAFRLRPFHGMTSFKKHKVTFTIPCLKSPTLVGPKR